MKALTLVIALLAGIACYRSVQTYNMGNTIAMLEGQRSQQAVALHERMQGIQIIQAECKQVITEVYTTLVECDQAYRRCYAECADNMGQTPFTPGDEG